MNGAVSLTRAVNGSLLGAVPRRPWPATNSLHTSVGTSAVGIPRRIDGALWLPDVTG
jgi:hypothetical protein